MGKTTQRHNFYKKIQSFMHSEAFLGLLLVFASLCSLAWSNSPWAESYCQVRDFELSLGFSHWVIEKTLLEWMNEGLMTLFFLLIALEIKIEFFEGKLREFSQWSLPFAGALGGMLVPALIFMCFNVQDAFMLRGWAIPTATDVAFSLGVCTIFGKRLPLGLKIFLMTLGILDDLGAILIVALYYTADLSLSYLSLAMGCVGMLWLVPRFLGRAAGFGYVLGGIALWVCLLHSGVSPTLTGGLLALVLPMASKRPQRTVRRLHPWVGYGIIPFFALLNLGIAFDGISLTALTHSTALGVALGLLIGKPLGIGLAAWGMVRMGWSTLPATWAPFMGVCCIAGIGFTMSLFISTLAYGAGSHASIAAWLGIVVGSFGSAILGAFILAFALPRKV